MRFQVTLPIAGHCVVEVDADDEEGAINAAFNVVELSDIEDWEALRQFNMGNVCYCPTPWHAEAEPIDQPDSDPPVSATFEA